MKKVLALVLAVMMMSTFAFAADLTRSDSAGNPGDKIILASADFSDATLTAVGVVTVPGFSKSFESKNYTIAIKYDKGKDLVESAKFVDDDNEFVITLKKNYTLERPAAGKENLIISEIKVTEKGSGKSVTLKDAPLASLINKYLIGYEVNELNTVDTKPGNIVTAVVDGRLNKVHKDLVYGTLNYTVTGGTELSVRVFAKEKYLLDTDAKVDAKVLIANADLDADITGLNFVSKPTFSSTATLTFWGLDEDFFVYENINGKLTKTAAKWDEDLGAWVLKARTLGNYVFSDKALAVSTAATSNPDTGANDVVGIATALAAVALVSAAAISLKK